MISIFDVLIQAAMLVFGAVFVVLAVAVGTIIYHEGRNEE
jgi:hypothetical protein